jgi:hypothetical protein
VYEIAPNLMVWSHEGLSQIKSAARRVLRTSVKHLPNIFPAFDTQKLMSKSLSANARPPAATGLPAHVFDFGADGFELHSHICSLNVLFGKPGTGPF